MRRRVFWVRCTEALEESVVLITNVVSHPAERVSLEESVVLITNVVSHPAERVSLEESVVFITNVVSHTAERVSFLLLHTYECIICTRRPFHALVYRIGQGTDFAYLKIPLRVFRTDI
jgi:hypothetical protein